MAAQGCGRSLVKSSLPFQMLLYFDSWYFGCCFFLNLALFTYKGVSFTYEAEALAAEIILVFILAGLEAVRIFLGYKGNLTEHALTVMMSLIFTITSLFGFLYLLLWQTYVLRADVILNSIEIVFIGLEIIFSIVCISIFARSVP